MPCIVPAKPKVLAQFGSDGDTRSLSGAGSGGGGGGPGIDGRDKSM